MCENIFQFHVIHTGQSSMDRYGVLWIAMVLHGSQQIHIDYLYGLLWIPNFDFCSVQGIDLDSL